MSNIEQLFKYPKEEISRMEKDFRNLFGYNLANFISQEAQIISSQYHDQCAHILVDRFIEINKVVENLPSEPSKKEYDQFVQSILTLAEPSEIAQEIELVIQNKDVYTYYQDFISRSNHDLFHELYVKCAFTIEATLQLNQLAMIQIKESITQLHKYINSLRAHNRLIKQIQEKRKDDSILKTGASLIGMGLGIPFLGMGLGALLGAGDKQKIQESLGNIFNHIDFLEDSLYNTIDKLGNSLYLLFLTLIGGTFVSVNNALKTQNITIQEMNEESIIVYSLTEEEKKKFEKWFHVSLSGITALVKEKRWSDAILIVKEMHQNIADKPIHSYEEIMPGKSALYIAHVYYFAVYQEALLEEYRAGHLESFVKRSEAFLETLILYPLEKDFPAFASNPAYFLFLYVKEYIHQNHNQLHWLEKSSGYISKRHENGVLMGEFGENATDYAENIMPFFIILKFYDKINNTIPIPEEREANELMYKALTEEKIMELISIDQSLNHPDQFTEFLHTLKKHKKKAQRAPIIRWSIKITVTVALIALLVVSLRPLIPIFTEALSNSKTFAEEKWNGFTTSTTNLWSSIFGNEEKIPEVKELGLIIITQPTVNIRETPSINGKVIATGYGDELYSFLNEEQVDAEGVTWLTIKLQDGRTAYVSKKVAAIQ